MIKVRRRLALVQRQRVCTRKYGLSKSKGSGLQVRQSGVDSGCSIDCAPTTGGVFAYRSVPIASHPSAIVRTLQQPRGRLTTTHSKTAVVLAFLSCLCAKCVPDEGEYRRQRAPKLAAESFNHPYNF
jgi:hypothetical protein